MAATAYKKIGGTGGTIRGKIVSAAADPTVDNDVDNGIYVGDRWFNTATGVVLVCTDITNGAAVWRTINVIQVTVQWTPTAPPNQVAYVANRPCLVLAAKARVEVAGTDAGAVTGQLVKAPDTTAVSAGTNLTTATFNLKGAAANKQDLTLAAAPATQLAAGDAIGLKLTGVLTLAVGSVTLLIMEN
jgi:hypothetical protein